MIRFNSNVIFKAKYNHILNSLHDLKLQVKELYYL